MPEHVPLRNVVEEKFGIATKPIYRTIGYISPWRAGAVRRLGDDVPRQEARTLLRLSREGMPIVARMSVEIHSNEVAVDHDGGLRTRRRGYYDLLHACRRVTSGRCSRCGRY